jgi:iron complex outermembrane receptor protein
MRLLPLFLVFALHTAAQDHCNLRITGRILEAAGTALPGAGIQLATTESGTVSDSSGYFTIDSICSGTYTLLVNYIGYEQSRTTVVLPMETELTVYMNQSVGQLKELEIVGEKITSQTTVIADTLSRKEMERAQGRSITEYLSQMTGVTALQTGTSILKPVIHGLHSQRILIMNAGIRQEGQQWGTEHAPEIDPFIAGKIAVLKGPSAIRYGSDAIGGVIIVEPRELPHEPGLNAEISLTGASNGRQGVASGMVEQHLGKFYDLCWRLQGTIKKAGTVHTPEVYLQNTSFEESNWSASIGIERRNAGMSLFFSHFNTGIGIFSGSHIGNLSDLQNVIETGEVRTDDEFSYRISSPRQEVKHDLFSLKAWLAAGRAGKLFLQYGYQYNQRFEFDADKLYNDSVSVLNLPEIELRLYTHTLDFHFESASWKRFSVIAGAGGMIQDNQYAGLRYFVPNYRLTNAGGYTLIRWKKDRTEIEGGGRIDFREQTVYRNIRGSVISTPFDFVNPGLSLGFIRKQSEQFTLQMNFSLARRPPSINEWFSNGLHHGTATYETGDSTLEVEKVYSAHLTGNWRTKYLAISATAYYSYINDYIYLSPAGDAVLTINGAFPAYSYSAVDAQFKGLDLSVEADITSKLVWESKNSLVFADNLSDHRYLELVPSPRLLQSITYSLHDTENWKNLEAGISLLAVMRQTRYTEGTDFTPPPAAYYLTGLDFSATRMIGKQEFRLGISVANLFNVTYRDYMNRFRYYAPGPGTNIMLRLNVPLTFKTAEHSHSH